MTIPFDSTQDFFEKFDVRTDSSFYDKIIFTDSKVGFSIKKNYPDDIRYKPAVRSDGTPDNVVTIWVSYTHPRETPKNIDLNKVPVRVRVANLSRFLLNHFDYNFEDNECPTKYSVEQSSYTPKPIDLEYNNDFFFNHYKNQFINEDGNAISGKDILDTAYKDHCDTVHILKGFRLRFKLLSQAKAAGSLGLLISFLKYILKTIFGRKLEEEDKFLTNLYGGYKKGSLKKLDEDSLNVFGYKAAKPVIIVFCTLVCATSLYRYYFGISGGYLSFVSTNNAKSISHGILTLWVLDAVFPQIIFWTINGIIKLRTTIIFR